MRVVSENSDEDLARNRAADEIRWPLRELTANLMRIARGAGKPNGVREQLDAALEKLDAYRDVAGWWPEAEISEAIAITNREFVGEWSEWGCGTNMMVRGALQIAASDLLGQGTQEAAGERELVRGLEIIERYRQENRTGKRKIKPFTERNRKLVLD